MLLLLPISYAGIGVRDASLIGFLSLYSVDGEMAVTISILMLSSQLIMAILAGIMILCKNLQMTFGRPEKEAG